jgi:hypothetical protein
LLELLFAFFHDVRHCLELGCFLSGVFQLDPEFIQLLKQFSVLLIGSC